MNRRETGALGEKLARDFLEKRGYRIIETNYRCPEGEIDIVAQHQDTLVIIEVRTKKSLKFGSPEESTTPTKMKRLSTLAACYGQAHSNLPAAWRIDIMAIELGARGDLLRIEQIENAVGGD